QRPAPPPPSPITNRSTGGSHAGRPTSTLPASRITRPRADKERSDVNAGFGAHLGSFPASAGKLVMKLGKCGSWQLAEPGTGRSRLAYAHFGCFARRGTRCRRSDLHRRAEVGGSG